MKINGLLMLGFLILLNSCQKDELREVFYKKAPKNPNEEELLELVNEYRQNGCDCGSEYFPPTEPVEWSSQLQAAAQTHSDDMDKNHFFGHIGSDETNAGDRILSAGYSWATYGENIGRGYKTEKKMVEAWIKSEGHCKNIMNPKFREMGVATKGIYATQIFAAKE